MPINPKDISLRGPSLVDSDQAKRYIQTVEPNAIRNKDGTTNRYVDEVYRLCTLTGYSAEAIVAQFCVETGAGTSPIWEKRLNPAGIGVGDVTDFGYTWKTPESAARGHLVHLSGYIDGYNRGLRSYLGEDPRYLTLLTTDYAQSAKVLLDLQGTWATDPKYGEKLAWRLEGMRNTSPTPPPPGPNPNPVTPPPMVWVGTSNSHARPSPDMIRFLVHHITDDMNVRGVIDWFKNPSSQASSTFVIDRDGTIYQMLPTATRSPWTNGDYAVNGNPGFRTDIPALVDAVNQVRTRGYNLNDFCVTIEYVGTPSNPPTEAQYRSGIAIAKYVVGTYPKVSKHRFGQLRHADINSITRPYCPGPKFDLERIIRELGGDPQRLS